MQLNNFLLARDLHYFSTLLPQSLRASGRQGFQGPIFALLATERTIWGYSVYCIDKPQHSYFNDFKIKAFALSTKDVSMAARYIRVVASLSWPIPSEITESGTPLDWAADAQL